MTVRYPASPGAKVPGPSTEAAPTAGEAATLRESALALLRRHALTADEVAQALGRSVLSVRPRITELVARGLIEDSGVRRYNASGKRATVWRVRVEAEVSA